MNIIRFMNMINEITLLKYQVFNIPNIVTHSLIMLIAIASFSAIDKIQILINMTLRQSKI